MNAPEPNFDDVRTLLTARPVEPLEKIESKVRRRRHWLLSGAFAVAMMLGAATALLASYLKLRNVPDTAAEITEIETPAAQMSVVPDVFGSELPAAENNMAAAEQAEEPAVAVEPTKARTVRRRATINPYSDLRRPRVVRESDEEDELQRIREAVLIDSWQERRARRAARRERRNRVDHHDRDLSNLDEIFQGPRRRPPG